MKSPCHAEEHTRGDQVGLVPQGARRGTGSRHDEKPLLLRHPSGVEMSLVLIDLKAYTTRQVHCSSTSQHRQRSRANVVNARILYSSIRHMIIQQCSPAERQCNEAGHQANYPNAESCGAPSTCVGIIATTAIEGYQTPLDAHWKHGKRSPLIFSQ